MKKLFFLILISFYFFQSDIYASKRKYPEKSEVKYLTVKFNKDYLKAQYLYIDTRTEDEKKENFENKKLSGDLLVLFHGHNQRPENGFKFLSELAVRSRSGIIIIPVIDTPFGKDKDWRGDKAKDYILMEIISHVLNEHGIFLDQYRKITNRPIFIEPFIEKKYNDNLIPVKLTVIGWSHGGLLARRNASAYTHSVNNLVQIAPAGFSHWGDNQYTASACLLTNFNLEGVKIFTGIFTGEASEVLDGTFGIIQGQSADMFRAYPSCIFGNFHFGKLVRNYFDLRDCTIYADDNNFPVENIRSINIILGLTDSLFKYEKMGIEDPTDVTYAEKKAFFSRFYPLAVKSGTKCNLSVLKGNHLGPTIYFKRWARKILQGTDQYK